MNYILEIKAFYDTLDTQTLPAGAISLWHALMHIANKTRWKESFTAPLSVLELKTGLTKQSVIRSRDLLAKLGYIKVSAAKGRSETATYSMVSLEYGADGSTDGADGERGGEFDEAKERDSEEGKVKRREKEASVRCGEASESRAVPREGSECSAEAESTEVRLDCRSDVECETPEEDEGPPPDFAEWLASVTEGYYGDDTDDGDYTDDTDDVNTPDNNNVNTPDNNNVNTYDTDRVNTCDTTDGTVPATDGRSFDIPAETGIFGAGVSGGVNMGDNVNVNTYDTDRVNMDDTTDDTDSDSDFDSDFDSDSDSVSASIPAPDDIPDYCSSYGEPYYDPDYVPDYGPFADSDFDPSRHRFERTEGGTGAREVGQDAPDYCSSYGEPYYDPDYVPDYGPFADSDFDPSRHRFERVNTPPEPWADSGAGFGGTDGAENAVYRDVTDRVNTDVNYHVNTYVTKHVNTDVNGGETINKLNVNVNGTVRDKTKLESESEKEKESEGEDEEGRAGAQSSRVCEGEKLSPSPCGGTSTAGASSPCMAPAAADREMTQPCDGLNVPDGLISREKLEEFIETRNRYLEKGYPPERVDAILMPLWGLTM